MRRRIVKCMLNLTQEIILGMVEETNALLKFSIESKMEVIRPLENYQDLNNVKRFSIRKFTGNCTFLVWPFIQFRATRRYSLLFLPLFMLLKRT